MPARLVVLTAAWAAALACHAAPSPQQGDRMNSPACRKALDALQTQEAAAASAPPGSAQQRTTRAKLKTLQRQAARACLGSSRAGERLALPSRSAQPPISVPPVSPGALPGQLPAASPPPLALPTQAPLVTLTACDATGCLASDGTRLHWVGPNLLGPRGLCTVHGVTLQCPNP